MAINTTVDDGGEDILPKPEPGPEGQDALGRLPVDESAQKAPEQDDMVDDDPLPEVDKVSSELGAIEDQVEDDNPPLVDLPHDEPRPPDDYGIPSSERPPPYEQQGAELASVDSAQEALSEPVSGEEGGPDWEATDDAQKALEDFGGAVEAFHGGGGMEGGFGGGEGGGGEGSSDDALKNLGDADIRNREASTNMLTDHARRLDAITERLERGRL